MVDKNLIGTQLRELLGIKDSQELIEARKIDGEQFFSEQMILVSQKSI
jgi:hypothetical protein